MPTAADARMRRVCNVQDGDGRGVGRLGGHTQHPCTPRGWTNEHRVPKVRGGARWCRVLFARHHHLLS
eukprot:24115-Eustigmatos_ZCMA.PRE.1